MRAAAVGNTDSYFGKIIGELQRRRVLRTAALYIVAAWLAMQVADVVFPALGISDRALRFVLFGAILGFPLCLFQLEAKIEKDRAEYLGPLGEIKVDIGAYDVDPIFVAGNLSGGFKNHIGICLMDEFITKCKRHQLRAMRLFEITNESSS